MKQFIKLKKNHAKIILFAAIIIGVLSYSLAYMLYPSQKRAAVTKLCSSVTANEVCENSCVTTKKQFLGFGVHYSYTDLDCGEPKMGGGPCYDGANAIPVVKSGNMISLFGTNFIFDSKESQIVAAGYAC